MFPIPPSTKLDSTESVHAALIWGLRRAFQASRDFVIHIEGEPGQLEKIHLDLTSACIEVGKAPVPSGKLKAMAVRLATREFQLKAQPLIGPDDSEFAIHAHAAGVEWEILEDDRQLHWLAPAKAQKGHFEVTCARHDFERLTRAMIRHLSAGHGIVIKETHLQYHQKDDRTVAVQLDLTGKARLVTGRMTVSGTMRINEHLELELHDLSCEGHGAVGTIATTMLRPQLNRFNGRTVPIPAKLLDAFQWNDIKLEINDAGDLFVRAEFG